MRKTTFLVGSLIVALLSNPAWAEGNDDSTMTFGSILHSKNICDDFDSLAMKKECWKKEGKSEYQLAKDKEELEKRAEQRKKALERAKKRKEELAKAAKRQREEEAKAAKKRRELEAKRKQEAEELAKLRRLEKENARKLKESRVIKTFFYGNLKYLGKLPYLADGIREARIVISGKTEVQEKISSANDICIELGFIGELEGTTAEKSEFYETAVMSRANKRKHGTSTIGMSLLDGNRELIKIDETSYYMANVFTRITCYRDKTGSDNFTLADYDREFERSKLSNRAAAKKGESRKKERGSRDYKKYTVNK